MTAKPAKPDRYQVDKIGTPDPPTTEYYVLDIVNDWQAREALAYLGRKYQQRGQEVRSKECFAQLDATLDAHRVVMEARNPKTKKKQGRKENAAP